MKKLLMILIGSILVVGTVFAGCDSTTDEIDNTGNTDQTTDTNDTTDTSDTTEKPTVRFSDLNWGSAHFQSEMAKIMAEAGYGYTVELIPGATIPLFQGLRSGDLDVYIEGWYQNQQEAYDEAMAAGDIEELGILNSDNWQSGFVVPTYVIKGDAARGIDPIAPGLKSVSDLVDYTEVFANPENPSKGLILNGPPGWECEIVVPMQVEEYGLADYYDTMNAGSSEGLFASLKSSYDKGEPWIGYIWGPTWISGKLDLTTLEEPAFDADVWATTKGCAFPSVDLFIAAGTGFSEMAPDLAEMFSKWKLDTATLALPLAYMNETGGEPIDAAIWFLKNHEDVWTKFVTDDAAAKIKTAVTDM